MDKAKPFDIPKREVWEAFKRQAGGDDIAVQCSVPDIGDVAGEQRIRLSPIGAIIVEHLASGELTGAETAARSPGRLIADPIRRIGDHELGLRPRQHLRHIRGIGAVAAAHPVIPQLPQIAAARDRLIGDFRNTVGIGQTARSQTGQNRCQPIRIKPDQIKIKPAKSSSCSSARNKSSSQFARAANSLSATR